MACIDRMHFSVSKNYKAIVNIYHSTLLFPLQRLYIGHNISKNILCTTLYMNWVRKPQLFALLESI